MEGPLKKYVHINLRFIVQRKEYIVYLCELEIT